MVGVSEDLGITAEKLMHAYIDENGRFVLINYAENDSVEAGNYESINKVAIQKNCSKFIIAEFTRLGQNVISSFKLYNINNEKPVWSDRLKAANPDDLDPIIERVARNIGTKKQASDDDDIYTITEQETQPLKKIGISGYFGLNIVGDLELTPNTNMLAGIGLFTLFDAKRVFLGLDFVLTNMGEELNNSFFAAEEFCLIAQAKSHSSCRPSTSSTSLTLRTSKKRLQKSTRRQINISKV